MFQYIFHIQLVRRKQLLKRGNIVNFISKTQIINSPALFVKYAMQFGSNAIAAS
jgi:hypothetical protein